MTEEICFCILFALIFIGLVLTFYGQFLIIRVIAKESCFGALVAFLIPFAFLVFVRQHWEESKVAFRVWAIGVLLSLSSLAAALVIENMS